MSEIKNITLKKVGILKYDRLKSISLLRKELNDFGFEYSISDVKSIFDLISNNKFKESFDRKFKRCIDSVFDGNIYQVIEYDLDEYINCGGFPENFIMPVSY